MVLLHQRPPVPAGRSREGRVESGEARSREAGFPFTFLLSSLYSLIPRGRSSAGEHLLCTQGVSGSNPLASTRDVRPAPLTRRAVSDNVGVCRRHGRPEAKFDNCIEEEEEGKRDAEVMHSRLKAVPRFPRREGGLDLRSSYKGRTVDALAEAAEEGRGKRRYAPGRRKQPLIRRCPNGETRSRSCGAIPGPIHKPGKGTRGTETS